MPSQRSEVPHTSLNIAALSTGARVRFSTWIDHSINRRGLSERKKIYVVGADVTLLYEQSCLTNKTSMLSEVKADTAAASEMRYYAGK